MALFLFAHNTKQLFGCIASPKKKSNIYNKKETPPSGAANAAQHSHVSLKRLWNFLRTKNIKYTQPTPQMESQSYKSERESKRARPRQQGQTVLPRPPQSPHHTHSHTDIEPTKLSHLYKLTHMRNKLLLVGHLPLTRIAPGLGAVRPLLSRSVARLAKECRLLPVYCYLNEFSYSPYSIRSLFGKKI
ncbi:uncharacterized protein Dana_GF26927 [Drosophila ananassae]|uniref:Uncharacterized protein n=1 Tax=Drosophila ananassae TaxID=7217 RepID=A0A0P8XTL5_DROAN|nr:uncharacterized protein Dana_GF26927 [Drosophila ananassae]